MRFQYRYFLVAAALMSAVVLALAVTLAVREPDPARAADVTINTGNFWFCDPSFEGGVCDTTIQVGDTVTWNWVAGIHTTTECGADCGNPTATPLWDAPLNSANTTFSRTFDTPGTYLYLCSFHPILMRGRIIVEEVSPTPPATPIPEATAGATPTPVAETPPPATPVRPEEPPPTLVPDGGEVIAPPPMEPAPEAPEVIGVPPTGAGSRSGKSSPWWPLVVAGAGASVAGVLLAYQGPRAKP